MLFSNGRRSSQRVRIVTAAVDKLERGRESYERRAWADAFQSLSLADRQAPLSAEDLELLAVSAYLAGRDDDFLRVAERAHHARLDTGSSVAAARWGFWLGLSFLFRGEAGRATGWLARAQRLIGNSDCVEQGYLLLPEAERNLGEGSWEAAYTVASDAVTIGERFGELDLIACARHLQGRALIRRRQVKAGVALLDEAMVAATAGELSPIVTGLVYCSVIEACEQAYVLGRAREWTAALTHWCEEQPDLVAFTATCLIRRAEILLRHGSWSDAIEEARRAHRRFAEEFGRKPPAAALYQLAEVHRLRGEYDAAEESYRNASQGGYEPQPGLALLWMAQGRIDAAEAAIRPFLNATDDPLQRARLLPACIEVMLAAGNTAEAREASLELEAIAKSFDTGVLGAMAAHARGAVELADGNTEKALGSLRRAWHLWQEFEVPHEAARARMLTGLACRAIGDEDGGTLELEAARAIFKRLGAEPDLARIDSLLASAPLENPGGLTRRELQVLRLVAAGKTNKAIAEELFLSERTIDRHVSKILTKLDVPSRVAATAYAYEHDLI